MNERSREAYTPLSAARQAELQAHRLASFRARAGAIAIDGLVVLCVIALIEIPFRFRGAAEFKDVDLAFDLNGIASLAATVLYFGLTAFFWKGRTLGKYLFRIRVLPVGQDHLSLARSLQRALAYSVSTAVLGLGFLQYFRQVNRQTLHDRIAETIVVEERPGPKR